ncbi:hypothetical protein ACP70R_034536 [Stipagrostis hirtigluma subsp. patula]
MDRSGPRPPAGGDRLSKLEGRVLGHIVSFLPAKEAARAALLSSRWRDVYAGAHTVCLEEPESPIKERDYRCSSPGYCTPPDPNRPPPFASTVSAALLARNHRGGAAPLRALRVAKEQFCKTESSTIDQWVSYAVQQAATEGLDLDLRLWCRRLTCNRPYSLLRGGQQADDDQDASASVTGRGPFDQVADMAEATPEPDSDQVADTANDQYSDDDSIVSSDDGKEDARLNYVPWWQEGPALYTVSRVVFSCAALRSLSLSTCQLNLPPTIVLPSLETLLLSNVSDPGSDVQRLISSCPRLADLTLEACDTVTTLSVLGGARLRRLALRCCHKLAIVTVDTSELQAFNYRGAVPDSTFLITHGGSGRIACYKVDICGKEVASEEELIKLWQLLQLFVNVTHLHLESARLGSGFDKDVAMRFPAFSSLRHLELRGMLPDDDTAAVAAVSRLLEHAPNLEVLSLIYHPLDYDRDSRIMKEEELLDAHHLSYNPYAVLAVPSVVIPCLRSGVKEINLVHYQGGRAQRTLAKFLLCNAPVIDEVWCDFAGGPLQIHTELMREIKGWVINKSANTHFS